MEKFIKKVIKVNVIEREDLKARKMDGLTMKDLRKFVESNKDLPDDTKVLVERITDYYFEGKELNGFKSNGWKVLLVNGEIYYNTLEMNKRMEEEKLRRDKGEIHYPLIEDPDDYITEITDSFKDQFFRAWCITKDDDFIYIHNHY